MTIILKNKVNNIVAQFPKDSVERFYIGFNDSTSATALTIVHTDGTVTILDERVSGVDINTVTKSLSEQLEQNKIVDELHQLKDKVSAKFEEVKSNAEIVTVVASIYKDVLVRKLFGKKNSNKTTQPQKEKVVKDEESVSENLDDKVDLNNLFDKLEKIIDSMSDSKTKEQPTVNEVIKQINDLHSRKQLTYTRLYELIGSVREDVKRKRSKNPELDLEEILSILKLNNLI